MSTRDELYFEPRVISESGRLRWYGYSYTSDELLQHIEETVYVRDNVKEIHVYKLGDDTLEKAQLSCIAKIEKKDKKSCYGSYFGKRDGEAEKDILIKIEQCKVDLNATQSNLRKRDLTKYMKRLQKELKRIRKRVS